MTGPLHAPQNCSCIYSNLIGHVGTIIKMSDCHFDFFEVYKTIKNVMQRSKFRAIDCNSYFLTCCGLQIFCHICKIEFQNLVLVLFFMVLKSFWIQILTCFGNWKSSLKLLLLILSFPTISDISTAFRQLLMIQGD